MKTSHPLNEFRVLCMRCFFLICFLALSGMLSAQDDRIAQVLSDLNNSIQNIPRLDARKQGEIHALKQRLSATGTYDREQLFQLQEQLYDAYKVYQYDSAYQYARKLQDLSLKLGDPSRINRARIKIGFLLLSSGMYKETLDSLAGIDIQVVPDSNKAEYYALMGRYYYDLADFDNDQFHTPAYNKLAAKYIDSALALWVPDSYNFLYYQGLKCLRSGQGEKAQANFTSLLNRPNLSNHQTAVTASTLSAIYIQNNDLDNAILLLAKSVMADIRSSTRETSAAFLLSTLLYKKGDIKNASVCIKQAFDDAVFYGARQRKMQVSAVLPLIEAQKLAIVESQKTKLIWYAFLVTFLLLLVLWLATVVYKQVQKLKRAQKELLQANTKTQEINKRLSDTNEKLNDANKIKEEYIGYFFNVNSEFFDKIERFKNMVEQKIADRKLDEIRFLVNNINLKREKDDLLNHFDRAFLKLFPNFVAEFNELFREEDRIRLKEGELLNTDLRIFALARMGIHENEKIAHILQYSVNTINTYKTRIKNKSVVPNEDFERRIMQIKTV